MCIKNKNYMENWLFWGLNLGNLKQCMMIMLVLTSSSSAWTLCSLLHISSLINICNFYSFWATGMVLTSKWGRILQEIHCQCQIWLKWSAAGRRPANFHKRNYLLSVNTTDFEKTTIQAHSAMSRGSGLKLEKTRSHARRCRGWAVHRARSCRKCALCNVECASRASPPPHIQYNTAIISLLLHNYTCREGCGVKTGLKRIFNEGFPALLTLIASHTFERRRCRILAEYLSLTAHSSIKTLWLGTLT